MGWDTKNHNLRVALIGALLLLALLGAASAAPTTVTNTTSIFVMCSDDSQCVAFINGVPVYFPGHNATTNLTIPYSYTYEPNITVVQNVTVLNVTNVTNITNTTSCNQTPTVNVTTQVVNVTSCNLTPSVNVSATEVAAGIIGQLNTSLVTSCRDACTIPDLERQNITLALALCQSEINNTNIECDAEKQSIIAGFDRDLNISRQETQTAQDATMPWMIVTVIALGSLLLKFFIDWRESKPAKIPSGAVVAPINHGAPQEYDEEELAELSNMPQQPPKKKPMRGGVHR